MPRGIAKPAEAKLGEVTEFLSREHREIISRWWLAVRERANTPNWDIASTATIGGIEGLMLVEAKAHTAEIKVDGKPTKPLAKRNAQATCDGQDIERHVQNHAQIDKACREASDALSNALPGWNLSVESHYQLCNRFSWTWKIASLGIPVVLIYLGFLDAQEMRDQGMPLDTPDHWERLVREHSRGIVPQAGWNQAIFVGGTPVHALIRSKTMSLDSAAISQALPS
jgi:hypothetical protein